MQDPILLAILAAILVVATVAATRWWLLKRPDPEVMALKAAARMLRPYTQANTPEALAAAQAKETLRKATLEEFKKLAESLQ